MLPIPDDDFHKLQSLSRATRGGTLEPLRLAVRAYEMGSSRNRPVIEAETLNLAELEKAALIRAITLSNGKLVPASRLLGIGKTTAYRKAKQFGIQTPRCREVNRGPARL